MVAATLCPQMTAATEHAPEVLRLQSTAIAANVVFINIDWKASRHNTGRLAANMELLGKTIAGVVRNMNPKMICMCEVGVASDPLTKEQMKHVRDQSIHAWQAAATGHFELRSMFKVGAPYMTIYIDGSVCCSRHRILTDLYCAQGNPRTAQTFLCCGPGGVTVDVINVHAPSGRKPLTDQQRKTLLTNLLQTNSESMPGSLIGSARFLIGGDMNTAPFLLSQVLQVCRGNGSLRTQAQIHDPVLGNHGDLCVLGGFKADSLTTTADNHDRKHKPYGICWSMTQVLALTTIPAHLEYGPSDQCLEHKTYDPECHMCTTYTAWEGDQDQLWAPQCSFTHSPIRPVFTPPGFFPINCATQWRSTIASDTAADAVPAVADAAPKWSEASDARTCASLAAEPHDEDNHVTSDHMSPPLLGSWLLDDRIMVAQVGLSKAIMDMVKAENDRGEMEAIWVKLQDVEQAHHAMAEAIDLINYRREAGQQLGNLDAAVTKSYDELEIRLKGLQKVAGEVLDSHQPDSPSTAKSDGAAMAASRKSWWNSWKQWTWRQPWKPWSEPDSETVADAAAGRALEAAPLPPPADQQTLYLRYEDTPSVRKQWLGELLLPKVTLLQPELARRICGMLLEREDMRIIALLKSDDELKPEVDKARAVLDEQSNPLTNGQLAAAPTAAATQLSADGSTPQLASQEVPADKMMIYSIVNEFLGKITFNDSAAEEMLIAALMHKTCLSPAVHLRVETVFSRVFFYYANGVNDRSGWQPRDTSKYIRQWSELATMRTWVSSGFAASTEHSEQLTKDQVSQIFKLYMEDMKSTLREEQLDKPWVYYKSCAEAKLRHQAGDKFVAKAIWAIGLPRLPSFATEQRGKPLSAQDLEAVPEAIDSVLNWLDRLASTLTAHHETNQYKTAVRKSGGAHRQSGLNATEQKTRRATRKANCDIQSARDLDRRWKNGTLTFQNWDPRQEALLRAYWNGSLQGRLKEAKNSRGSADPMCRTPLQPLRL